MTTMRVSQVSNKVRAFNYLEHPGGDDDDHNDDDNDNDGDVGNEGVTGCGAKW